MNSQQLIDAAKLYYRLPGNGAGGNLHLVLDDGNCDDDSMWVCIKSCTQESDKMGLYIAAAMLFIMTEAEREKFYCDVAGINYDEWTKMDFENDLADEAIYCVAA